MPGLNVGLRFFRILGLGTLLVALSFPQEVQLQKTLDSPAIVDQEPAEQKTDSLLEELNALLENFGYNKPKLEIAAGGSVVRKDLDGTEWKFNFGDIGDIVIEREGEAHIVLYCRGNNGCIERSFRGGADRSASPFLAFSLSLIHISEPTRPY